MAGLFSHRTGILYLEHCRVVAADGQLSFVRSAKALDYYWSIPHANVCALLLGPGTSLTHQAAHKLAEEGVLVGFSSGGGTPIFYASLSEYRPTEYCQAWYHLWTNPHSRLELAKHFARARATCVSSQYVREYTTKELDGTCQQFALAATAARSTDELLGREAQFAKAVYTFHAKRCGQGSSVRTARGKDPVNAFIDAGN